MEACGGPSNVPADEYREVRMLQGLLDAGCSANGRNILESQRKSCWRKSEVSDGVFNCGRTNVSKFLTVDYRLIYTLSFKPYIVNFDSSKL